MKKVGFEQGWLLSLCFLDGGLKIEEKRGGRKLYLEPHTNVKRSNHLERLVYCRRIVALEYEAAELVQPTGSHHAPVMREHALERRLNFKKICIDRVPNVIPCERLQHNVPRCLDRRRVLVHVVLLILEASRSKRRSRQRSKEAFSKSNHRQE